MAGDASEPAGKVTLGFRIVNTLSMTARRP